MESTYTDTHIHIHFVNNEVKAWKEEKKRIKLASKKYLNNKKWKAKCE